MQSEHLFTQHKINHCLPQISECKPFNFFSPIKVKGRVKFYGNLPSTFRFFSCLAGYLSLMWGYRKDQMV